MILHKCCEKNYIYDENSQLVKNMEILYLQIYLLTAVKLLAS